MANDRVVPPAGFVGRAATLARFTARLDHFRFFVYEGIAGIGKTALLLRLAEEARRGGLAAATYLSVAPGESIASLLARLQCRLAGQGQLDLGVRGDPYSRLVELLGSHRTVLLLDALHNLRPTELPALVRMLHRHRGDSFRVVAAMRGDPGLAALDRAQLHLERVGGLTAEEADALARPYPLGEEARALLRADAARGGATAQPLTCLYLLKLGGGEFPSKGQLGGHSARSTYAFRALVSPYQARLAGAEREAMVGLARLGTAVGQAVAQDAFGAGLNRAVRRGLIDVVAGDVQVHAQVMPLLEAGTPLQGEPARRIAAHLHERATRLGEPLAAIRAAEVLAHAGDAAEAIDSLAQCSEWASDAGFRDAYLKALATVPATPALAPRLRLLAAQARLQHGAWEAGLAEMQRLAADADAWTRGRALAACAKLAAGQGRHAEVIAAFSALAPDIASGPIWLQVGSRAAEALLRLDRPGEAEALAQQLLAACGDAHACAGTLRRILGYACAQTGELTAAATHAAAAAQHCEQAGDLAQAGMAYGFIGDLYREAGEFEQARAACAQYRAVAARWGDRNMIQLAELADAWVSLDVGDVAHAAKLVAAVEKELGVAADRRLRRYLAAAQALLEAGRGHHVQAAEMLARVVGQWDAAGEHGLTGGLRAQHIRSLIACDRLDEAALAVAAARRGLDPQRHGARLAALLRESAILHLRRGDPKTAMAELTEARELFVKHGNRREAALTLHRIAHAALDEGDVTLAVQRAGEALALATEIGHERAVALSFELQARLAMLADDAPQALARARDALAGLRRLGDEIGVLHVSETLLRAYLFAGDVASALRLGPRLRDHAARLGVPEVRIRAVALTGVALLRRERPDLAQRCFRELPRAIAPWTRALMGRFGEGLAHAQRDAAAAQRRRPHWLAALRQMPRGKQQSAIAALQQLALAPRERCELRAGGITRQLGTEEAALLDPAAYTLCIDVLNRRIYDGGTPLRAVSVPHVKLALRVALAYPAPMPYAQVLATLGMRAPAALDAAAAEALCAQVQAGLAEAPHLRLACGPQGITLTPPPSFAVLAPIWVGARLSASQREIVKLLRRLGSAPLQTIQAQCQLSRGAVRRELAELTGTQVLQAVREGRGQVYRLA